MIAVKSKTKKWGNSMGVIIPKETVDRENLKEGEELEILFLKKTNTLRETFGLLKGKLKRSTDEMLRESDKELWGIDRKS